MVKTEDPKQIQSLHIYLSVALSVSIYMETDVFYSEGGNTLEQVAQRGGGRPIPRNIQGQIGPGPKQPGIVEDFPAYGGHRWPLGRNKWSLKVPSNPNDSMMLWS